MPLSIFDACTLASQELPKRLAELTGIETGDWLIITIIAHESETAAHCNGNVASEDRDMMLTQALVNSHKAQPTDDTVQ